MSSWLFHLQWPRSVHQKPEWSKCQAVSDLKNRAEYVVADKEFFYFFSLPKAIQQKILQKNLFLSDSLSFLYIVLPAIRCLSLPVCLYRSYLQQSVSLRSRCLKTTMWSTARCSTDRKSRVELGFWAWIKRGRPWRATGSKRPNQLRISCLNL